MPRRLPDPPYPLHLRLSEHPTPPPPSPLSLPCLPLPACSAVEVWHLQRVLAKKRDPLTHALFLDVVAPGDDDPLPLDRFW